MHQCIKFILFWSNTLHVSYGLSVHHQELRLYIQQQAFVRQVLLSACFCLTYACCCMYSLELLMMDGKTI